MEFWDVQAPPPPFSPGAPRYSELAEVGCGSHRRIAANGRPQLRVHDLRHTATGNVRQCPPTA